MSINYYIDVPLDGCIRHLPMKTFGKDMIIDLREYAVGYKIFFTFNMQIAVQRTIRSEFEYIMSVVRRDGREFEHVSYLSKLKEMLFPKDYVIYGSAFGYEDEFKPLYPMWVNFDAVERQSPHRYNEGCISRSIVKRVVG